MLSQSTFYLVSYREITGVIPDNQSVSNTEINCPLIPMMLIHNISLRAIWDF